MKRKARLPTKLPLPRQQLIDAGCNGRVLDSFVADWNFLKNFLKDKSARKSRKSDLDRFKTEIRNLAASLERIAAGAAQLGQRKRYNGDTWEEALVFYFADTPETAVPPDFFSYWPTEVRQHAALLKKLEAAIARDWSTQHPDELYLLMLLECYCRVATNGRATIRQIADLIEDGETAVRMRLMRFRQAHPCPPDFIRQWEQSVKRYIAAVPSGDLTYQEWVLREGPAILKKRTASEVGRMFAAQSPWYRGK